MLSFLFLAIITGNLGAQADITPKVTDAFKKGDATSLSSLMMPQVEFTLSGQDGTYPNSEVKSMLTRFFSANQVKDFTVKHQGTSKLDDQYRIGDLLTSNGVFRVTFFMKKNASGMLIKQLKIESPDDF